MLIMFPVKLKILYNYTLIITLCISENNAHVIIYK